MALFSVQGRLKLRLNSEGSYSYASKNPVHYKLNGCISSGGLLGFSEFCYIHPVNVNENNFRRNVCWNKWRILGSSRSNSSKTVKGDGESIMRFDDGFDVFSDDEEMDDDDDDDVDDDDLSCFRGLVLDISYRPINVVCWKRAICLEFMEKADVLEYYEQTMSSPSGSFNIPAVLRVPHLLQVVKRKRVRNTLSRKNIFYRDGYTCQYCSATSSLTIDHVVPMSRGGKWEWDNLVTACAKCNSKKGQKTLEEANMNLPKVPKAPKEYDILAIPLTTAAIRMLKLRKGTPQEWNQYLP